MVTNAVVFPMLGKPTTTCTSLSEKNPGHNQVVFFGGISAEQTRLSRCSLTLSGAVLLVGAVSALTTLFIGVGVVALSCNEPFALSLFNESDETKNSLGISLCKQIIFMIGWKKNFYFALLYHIDTQNRK
jgi:hypothetical protein